ncbi:MAG: NADH-quinone oxidoreductase subunit L [Saprospiraceae bacterium]|nr:NADH-quinone oxidoreductase subunit L [Saprospiraceae bacterium]MBK7737832.1 NADH-quinone oxidoreductase subunit L [Saprospiraceae bacterium]MBK7913579.1 NADH-quinone oxidoreductase subunit L [Saprospiraceae bacterium]
MDATLILHIILWPPLIGFLINGLFGNSFPKWAVSILACLGPLTSFVGTVLAYTYLSGPAHSIPLYTWFIVEGSAKINFGFYIDHLAIIMLFVVTGVGSLIHAYSTGYMHDDKGYSRFMSYMNLFLFSMLLLVLGSNLVVLFAGWEGVGLCSFLLIGFWFENKEYNRAAAKAFIMNRIGDLGFLVAIFLIINKFGGIEFTDIHETIMEEGQLHDPQILLICLLLFLGVCGKSAQIPLFTWLPDAMAGPTPVSALIHAATMVTAGIYLIARMYFLFDYAPQSLTIIAITGCITALVAATIALKQNDIKKILAYSTVSQLGYMAVALGVGAYISAVFHLMTHAFFKALLFLGAGSVIHGLHGEQDISKMGGLKSKMKWTYAVMLIGTLAIVGCPPFAGFFSKDEILAAVYSKNFWFFLVLAFASVFTAWYMFRLLFATFHGQFRGSEEKLNKVHESSYSMVIPLVVLAVFSILGGFVGLPEITGGDHKLYKFLVQSIAHTRFKVTHLFEYSLWGVTVLALVSIGYITFKKYATSDTKVFEPGNSLISRIIVNKFYLDELYAMLFVNPLKKTGSWIINQFEYGVIDRLIRIPDNLIESSSYALKNLQSGKLSWYLLSTVVSILLIVLVFIYR